MQIKNGGRRDKLSPAYGPAWPQFGDDVVTALAPARRIDGERPGPRVAVLVPCYNEAATVAQVVADFARALPGAAIFVFDNGSTDETVAKAAAAGALVRHAPL